MSLDYYSFDPRVIPWQWEAMKKIAKLDYSKRTHEFAFCGILGSAKTTLAAWMAIDHCCKYRDAEFFIGRRSYTDLKETSFKELVELIEATWGKRAEKWSKIGDCSIEFPWGSRIIGGTWGDGRYEKFKSKKYSAAWLEEPTENKAEEYLSFMGTFRGRVGRINPRNSDVQENFIISSFNAYDPDHPIYDDFYIKNSPYVHLFESLTRDNPFLQPDYYEALAERLDPVNYARQVLGEWKASNTDKIYYSYKAENNFKNEDYEIDPYKPIHICWDFNIGVNKPMSGCLFQYDGKSFHFFDEFIIDGARTMDTLEDLANRGLIRKGFEYKLHGDATGSSRDTRSKVSDWGIIRKFFANFEGIKYSLQVPKSNPPIRKRHNTVNSYMENQLGEHRLFLYRKCKTLDKGFRLTALKKGGSFIEDDSRPYQHVTTAAGYGICSTIQYEPLRGFNMMGAR